MNVAEILEELRNKREETQWSTTVSVMLGESNVDLSIFHWICKYATNNDDILFVVETIEKHFPNDMKSTVHDKSPTRGRNAFHWICSNRNSTVTMIETVMYTIMRSNNYDGGKKVIFDKDYHNATAFHWICYNTDLSLDNISFVAQKMREICNESFERTLVTKDRDGDTPFNSVGSNHKLTKNVVEGFVNLVKNVKCYKGAICSKNNDGCNAYHIVHDSKKGANPGNSETIESVLNTIESFVLTDKDIFFAKNKSGDNIVSLYFSKKGLDEEGEAWLRKLLLDAYPSEVKAILDSFGQAFSNTNLSNFTMRALEYCEHLEEQHGDLLDHSHSLTKNIMNIKFVRKGAVNIIMVDLYCQIVLVAIFSFVIEKGPLIQTSPDLQLGLLVPSIFWHIFREVVQFMNQDGEKPYSSIAVNYIDIAHILLVSLTIVFIADDRKLASTVEQGTLLLATFAVWIKLLFVVGNLIFKVSVFNTALIKVSLPSLMKLEQGKFIFSSDFLSSILIFICGQVVQTLMPFVFTTAFIIFAFAHLFYFAGPRGEECGDSGLSFGDGDWTCSRPKAYVGVFHMLLTTDWPLLGTYPLDIQAILSILYAFVIGIVLLNLIIAVISTAFDEITSKSEETFWYNRRQVLSDVNTFYELFKTHCYEFNQQGYPTAEEINFDWLRKHDPAYLKSSEILCATLSDIFRMVAGAITFGLCWSTRLKMKMFCPAVRFDIEDEKYKKQTEMLEAKIDALNDKLELLLQQLPEST